MFGLYLGFLGFGVTVIGLLLAMGGARDGDADHGGGDHAAVGAHVHDGALHHGDAGGAPQPDAGAGPGELLRIGPAKALLSVRFWTFFAAAFGGTGTLATLAGIAEALTFAAALLTGLAVGAGAHALFRTVQADRVSGETDLSSLAGEEATVLVAIRPGARGQVRVQRPSGTHDLLATSRDGAVLDVGSAVLVTAVERGVADVTGALPARKSGANLPRREPERP